MYLLIWTVTLLAAAYLYLRNIYRKFERLGVNHLPVVPVLGNTTWSVLKKEHRVYAWERAYKAFPDDKILGAYEFTTPVYIAKDLELLKKITLKDFDHFVDRREISNDDDPVFRKILFLLTGDEWKAMRATLSPAFTSSKIRLMVPFMVEVGEHMMNHLRKKIKESGVGYIDIDIKDMSTRYANDVIATCAFGLKVDSADQDNVFYTESRAAFTVSALDFAKILMSRSFPRIMKMVNFLVKPKPKTEFFVKLVLDTMKQREEQNIVRNDMIHLLMEAKKGNLSHDPKDTSDGSAGFATVEESALGKKTNKYEWTDTYLVAQAFLFLLAGFETISTVMSFLLHELAVNPDIQDKLYEEVKAYHDNNNGKFDYNSIQNMTYLDMVVSESLRLWLPAPVMDRLCVKDYNLGKPNDKAQKDVIIRKGEGIMLPFWAIQRDPNYFPDPDKFDPERFSETNKHNIKPFTYLPFGVGPRNCIGSRFALCELKVVVYQLMLNMEVMPCEKTCIPARLAPDVPQMRMQGGHWLRMKLRNS